MLNRHSLLTLPLTIALILASLSCRPHKEVQLIAQLQGTPRYFDELKHWYFKKRIYSDLEVRFYVEVTYMSKPLIHAYVAEYAKAYSLSEEQQTKMLNEELLKFALEDVVVVSLFSPGKNWDRLDLTDNIWKLRVEYLPSGPQSRPTRLQELSLDDPKFSYFYPYAADWARHYRVTVPANSQADALKFTMEGVLGAQEFQWARPK